MTEQFKPFTIKDMVLGEIALVSTTVGGILAAVKHNSAYYNQQSIIQNGHTDIRHLQHTLHNLQSTEGGAGVNIPYISKLEAGISTQEASVKQQVTTASRGHYPHIPKGEMVPGSIALAVIMAAAVGKVSSSTRRIFYNLDERRNAVFHDLATELMSRDK
jgi:hypothetical protein